ncbi:hypothetical protein MUP38_06150, partial [Candidatus Bathyarchaeota archaeon]|nr:hypothetical protein [Candidatus Bathyarchaeota archaeon]
MTFECFSSILLNEQRFFEDKNNHSLIYSVMALTHVTAPPQVFIPGKNWRLSLAELIAFLEAREVKFEVCQLSREFFAVSTDDSASALAIADLGG